MTELETLNRVLESVTDMMDDRSPEQLDRFDKGWNSALRAVEKDLSFRVECLTGNPRI